MTQLTIDGTAFRIDIAGDPTKPALILSNSLGTTLELWDGQMPALLEHFRVIRYDSRGHGGSIDASGPFSIPQLGHDVLAILDALEIETAHFIGISMGGAVGQWLLVNAPDRIERAVLANTAARIGTSDGWNGRIRSVLADGMDETATAAMERWFSAEFADRNPQVVSAQREMMRRTPAQGYASSCAALRDMDLREAIRGVRHPVLVIAGADDPVTSRDDIATLLSALNNGRLVTLSCRHLSNVEAAAAFNEAVVAFLTGKIAVLTARGKSGPSQARAARRVGPRALVARALVKKASTAKPAANGRTASKASRPAATASVRGETSRKTTRKTSAKRAAKGTKSGRTGTTARKRGTGSVATQTATRRAVKAATAAPRKKASPGKGTPKVGTRSKSVGKVAPARRATPAASARASKSKSPVKSPVKSSPKGAVAKSTSRKSAAKTTGVKLPSPRRKPAAGRPQGRGKARGTSRGGGRGKGRGKS